jgi:peptidoglycan glycosyltransferase
MKQVKRRTWFCLVFTILLALGLAVFLGRYISDGAAWASFSANKHIYDSSGSLMSGSILDRNGEILYDAATGEYNEDKAIRRATLHAVGDSLGNIATGATSAFTSHLSGFNPILGTTAGGHDLYLTLDADLCNIAYGALNGKKGTVGVYNYKTGEILCMVSLPTFDPADPPTIVDGDERYEGVYLNRFLSATYTPGSVFKTVTAAAAIENISDLDDFTYTCTGSLEIGGDTVTCPSAHGEVDFSTALAKSCNGAFATLANELGGKTLWQYAKKAGLLDSVSVSGLSTAAGSFTAAEDGSADLGWSGAGQYLDLVNPCAMMTYMGTIANGGTTVLPRLLHKETTSSGLPAALFRAEQHAEMMRNNVLTTYGQNQFGSLAVCAKSGTAEVGEGQKPHSWFVGFVDDEEHPLAFAVVVENGGGGAAVAGSIAAKVLTAAADLGY